MALAARAVQQIGDSNIVCYGTEGYVIVCYGTEPWRQQHRICHSMLWYGRVGHGVSWRGVAWRGAAGQGRAWHGMLWHML